MRIFNKKAVSPLIATVLLIAFAVALGAIVMNWGRTYVKTTTDFAATKSSGQVECSIGVDFSIKRVDYNTSDPDNYTLKIIVENNEKTPIEKFTTKLLNSEGAGYLVELNNSNNPLPLAKFDVATLIIDEVNTTSLKNKNVSEIKMIPQIASSEDPDTKIDCNDKYEDIKSSSTTFFCNSASCLS